MGYPAEYSAPGAEELGQKLEDFLKGQEGSPVWVPGIMNGAMGGTLRLMAKHGLLSEEAKKLLGL